MLTVIEQDDEPMPSRWELLFIRWDALMRWGRHAALLLFVLLSFGDYAAFADKKSTEMTSAERLPAGASRFEFEDPAGRVIKVYAYRPEKVEASTPVLFVLHGVERDARRYLSEWRRLAAEKRVILVVPEFSNRRFPGAEAYNQGNLYSRSSNELNNPEEWSFSIIEPLFEAVRGRTGTKVGDYSMFGHSAGAQFVHRFMLLFPEARVNTAVAANAGWYTFPDLATQYPYGLDQAPASRRGLRTALENRLILLLGTADIASDTANLKSSRRLAEQGDNRFERGHRFFDYAMSAADELGAGFGWEIAYAPGIAHDNQAIAPYAMRLLYPDRAVTAIDRPAGVSAWFGLPRQDCSADGDTSICDAPALALEAEKGASARPGKSEGTWTIRVPSCSTPASFKLVQVDAEEVRNLEGGLDQRISRLADSGAELILITQSQTAGRIERRGGVWVIHLQGRSKLKKPNESAAVDDRIALSLRLHVFAGMRSDMGLAVRLYPLRKQEATMAGRSRLSERELLQFANTATHIRYQSEDLRELSGGQDKHGPYLQAELDRLCSGN